MSDSCLPADSKASDRIGCTWAMTSCWMFGSITVGVCWGMNVGRIWGIIVAWLVVLTDAWMWVGMALWIVWMEAWSMEWILRYRGMKCKNWTAHAPIAMQRSTIFFLFFFFFVQRWHLTDKALYIWTAHASIKIHYYYTRSIKSKWPRLVVTYQV